MFHAKWEDTLLIVNGVLYNLLLTIERLTTEHIVYQLNAAVITTHEHLSLRWIFLGVCTVIEPQHFVKYLLRKLIKLKVFLPYII